MEQYNSRNADKFVVRLREGQRERMRERAETEVRSMNDLAVAAIDRYMAQGEAFDHVLSVASLNLKEMAQDALRYRFLKQHGLSIPGHEFLSFGETADRRIDAVLNGCEPVEAEIN